MLAALYPLFALVRYMVLVQALRLVKLYIFKTQLRDPHFFQNCYHFQYSISRNKKTKSADVVLKMITILKELRIVQLCSKN
jgi:hypothetical protein